MSMMNRVLTHPFAEEVPHVSEHDTVHGDSNERVKDHQDPPHACLWSHVTVS